MKNIVTKMLLLMLALPIGSQLHAQFTTTFAKNVIPGQQSGLYYSLPQTMLKLDVVVEETRNQEGPLSDYASAYFDSEDYVEYDYTEYRLVDVKMTSLAVPDPNASFFVAMASGRGSSKVQFEVLPNGIISSVGAGNEMETTQQQTESCPQTKPCCDRESDETEGFIKLMSSGKTNAMLAKEASDKIEEIRKAKFYLISGDVEMASNPETFKTMYEKLDAMEQEYTSLFLGKRLTKKIVKSLYVIPNKDVVTQTVAKFSETDGLSAGTDGLGSPITVQTLSLNTTGSINAPSQSAVESMSYENKVFYRIPEVANVKVSYGGSVLFEERVPVNQLGTLLVATMTNAKLVFDTNTGQIVNMRMQ